MYKLPSANNIFIPELALQIAEHLPWSSLAYFTEMPDPGPSVVARELHRRLLKHLARFIPPEHTDDFCNHLESAGAVITGSFVRQLLQDGEDGARKFKGSVSNLNIVVSRYQDELISSSLVDYGFSRLEGRVAGPFRSVSHSFAEFYRANDEDGQFPSITLTSAEAGVMSVILAAPTTADMTFFTATELVSLFPRLLVHNEALAVETSRDVLDAVAKVENQGVRVDRSNQHWTKPCDLFCPMRHRKTYGDLAVTRLRWHENRIKRRRPRTPWTTDTDDEDDESSEGVPWHVDADDIMYKVNLAWRIWHRCCNPHCSNFSLYSKRKEFVKP